MKEKESNKKNNISGKFKIFKEIHWSERDIKISSVCVTKIKLFFKTKLIKRKWSFLESFCDYFVGLLGDCFNVGRNLRILIQFYLL